MPNRIITLEQAENFAASLPEAASLPTFEQYLAGLEDFLRESAEWAGLDHHRFYSVNRWGYYESSDNADGGLSVDWAFYAAHKECGDTLLFADSDSIKEALALAEAAYVELCREYREALDI